MPNLKIYVDEVLYDEHRSTLPDMLLSIRKTLCDKLNVDTPTCQLAIIPVVAIPDLPRINVELMILPKPDRTRGHIIELGKTLQTLVSQVVPTQVAVRVATLDSGTYVALK